MPKRHLWMIMIFLCGLFVFAGYRDSNAAVKAMPFRQGERIVYRAMWGGIPAGEAVIEVLPSVAVDGARTHHFAMTMTTNSQVEMFYKLPGCCRHLRLEEPDGHVRKFRQCRKARGDHAGEL
jgi:hypothetical protein